MALYVRDCYDCFEHKCSEDRVECLCVRIRGKANGADVVVGVYCRPPTQDREVDEIFYMHIGDISRSLVLVFVGDFNFPDICWKYSTAEQDQAWRFLGYVGDNFLTQLVREPTREGALLDLLFVNREGLVDDVEVGGRLGHSDHEIVEFSILREARRGLSRTDILDFQRADFDLFEHVLDRIPWEMVLKDIGIQEG